MSDIKGNNIILLRVIRVDFIEFLFMENFNYKEKISKYRYFKGVIMEDIDIKSLFSVYVILGISDYAKIKIYIGVIGEFVVEYIFFGWIIILLGIEIDLDKMFLA